MRSKPYFHFVIGRLLPIPPGQILLEGVERFGVVWVKGGARMSGVRTRRDKAHNYVTNLDLSYKSRLGGPFADGGYLSGGEGEFSGQSGQSRFVQDQSSRSRMVAAIGTRK